MTELAEPGHELVAGATRTGKSRFVLYKIVRSLLANRPLCYIDPKGETYEALLALLSTTEKGQQLWESLKHRIILVNPVSASNTIMGFNALSPLAPFANATPDYTALLANSIVSHIRKQSGFEMAEANRMQNIMSAAIGLLVEGGGGKMTLAELPLLFVHTQHREKGKTVRDDLNPLVARLLRNVSHYGTLSFWQHQWANWTTQARKEWVQSTEGRIFQYLFDQRLLYSVCAVQTASLDLARIVRDGYWLFVKLPYQLVSDTVTMLLGNLLVSKLFYACMQREAEDGTYRLILDEARFFNSGPLEMIMDTAGAYNLWLTLVVQNLEQMALLSDGRYDYRLRDSIVTNCRYFTVFNDATDSELFARLMYPVTGQIAMGTRANGDYEYLPVTAEQNYHQRKFMDLNFREVILYDKMSGQEPQVWVTPDVPIRLPERSQLDYFEGEHLRLLGYPAMTVHEEISNRQKELYEEIVAGSDQIEEQRRQITPPMFGGLA